MDDKCAALQAILDDDQADRSAGRFAGLSDRDRERREQVEALLLQGAVRTGADHFAAAMIFQHGSSRESYWRAHELAMRAVELGHTRARWLVAASYDRWLMHDGQPQKYGTQYRTEGERWILWPVDPLTTDDERAALGVPPLAEAEERAARMNRRSPPRWVRGDDGVVRQVPPSQ